MKPKAALWLSARKRYFALHSYEAYDLTTMVRKDALLARLPLFLPFGAVVALWTGVAAGDLARRRPRSAAFPLAPVWAFAIATFAPMVIFYVTARQRNALLPAAAVLAACGLREILRRNQVLPALAAAAIAILLSVNGQAQTEDWAGWFGMRNMFDQAIAMETAGRWAEADVVLRDLRNYRPMRENRAVSSVAYYRARAAQHLGRDPRPCVRDAEHEAPGNEHVLALAATLGDKNADRLLHELHDPFTAQRALLAAR